VKGDFMVAFRKKKMIVQIILVLIFVIVAVVVLKQKNNIRAVVDAQKFSTQEIEEQISQNQEEIQKSLEKYDLPVVRDFTDEEEKKIMNGEITPQEAVELIMSEQTEENSEGEAGNDDDKDSTAENSYIGEGVAQIYSLKAYYLGKIGTLVQEAKTEYKSGTPASQIIKNKMSEGVALEKECDAQVYSIIDEMEAAGAEPDFIETLKTAYEKEKGLKKSYYISQLK
jgi:hypothetical protein